MSTRTKFQIIVGENVNEVEQHGAEELKKYIEKMLGGGSVSIEKEKGEKEYGVKLLIGKTAQGKDYLKEKGINLSELDEDGFILLSGKIKKDKFVIMRGKGDRGTLYSVYTFLEKQGCRFFEPYHPGEVIPERKNLIVDNLFERQNPSLPFRELDFDCMPEWNIIECIKILDWMVKNKLNTVMFTLARNSFIGFLPALIKEARRRNLTVGIGGHYIFGFLILPEEIHRSKISLLREPQEAVMLQEKVLKENPDWKKYNSVPTPVSKYYFHNPYLSDPCLSNQEVVNEIKKNLIVFLINHPEVKFVRFQVADSFPDSERHCECEKCLKDGKFNTNHFEDIYFEAVKSIAQELEKECPDVAIAYTYLSSFCGKLYSGNKKPDNMPKNVKYFYICIEHERYDCSLFSEKYGGFHPELIKWGFSELKGSGRKLVFKEMHGSGYWCGLLRNTPHIIAENMKHFRSYGDIYAGSMIFANLAKQNHTIAWHSFGLIFYTYYRLVWNIEEDINKLLDDFFEKYFAEGSIFMKEWYRIIEEKAMHLIVSNFIGAAWGGTRYFEIPPPPEMMKSKPYKDLMSEENFVFVNEIMEDINSGGKLLDRARSVAKEKEVLDRLEIDKVSYQYLSSFLRFKLRHFRAAYFYRKSISLNEKSLLEKSEEELEKANELLNSLVEAGIGGYSAKNLWLYNANELEKQIESVKSKIFSCKGGDINQI